MKQIQRYGWIPDLPDHRDRRYATLGAPVVLPPSVDLRPGCPPVYDQGQLGSCTANAIAAALEFDQMKQKLTDVFTPSRLQIYYNERMIEGTVNSDSGAQIRDGIKSVNTVGAGHEPLWPYDIAQFAVAPPPAVVTDGEQHPAVAYARVTNTELDQMRHCLAMVGPIVGGFSVYESFESAPVAASGVVPLPGPSESQIGGHAILVVGYDDASQRFLVRNSWGASWGQAGYFTIPYAYFTDANLADDFWAIQIVK